MALQGTLDTFALADLVRLMATTTKTGELTIEDESQVVAGRLWFVDGDLVAGEPGDAEDALFVLLRLDGGSFHFAPESGPGAAVAVDARDALDVLATAEARVEAWRPVEALVPHPDVALRLRDELADAEVTIDRDTWRQVHAVAGGTTARRFAAALDLDEVGAALAVKALADRGLVEVDVADLAADLAVTVEEPVALVAVAPLPEETVDAPVFDDQPVVEQPFDDEQFADVDEPAPVDPIVAGHDDTAGWGAGWDVTPVPGDPFAPVLPAEAGGDLAVDLDSHLGGTVAEHRYLGGEASTLPEALPGAPFTPALVPDLTDDDIAPVVDEDEIDEDDVDVEILAAEAATVPPAEPTVGGREDDLALQLEALSPAAARAVAAAASAAAAEEGNDDGDAGRRVLRRIISSGRG